MTHQTDLDILSASNPGLQATLDRANVMAPSWHPEWKTSLAVIGDPEDSDAFVLFTLHTDLPCKEAMEKRQAFLDVLAPKDFLEANSFVLSFSHLPTLVFSQVGDNVQISCTTSMGEHAHRLESGSAGEIKYTTHPGTVDDLNRWHRRFSHLHLNDDWFQGEPDLLAAIAAGEFPMVVSKVKIPSPPHRSQNYIQPESELDLRLLAIEHRLTEEIHELEEGRTSYPLIILLHDSDDHPAIYCTDVELALRNSGWEVKDKSRDGVMLLLLTPRME